MSITIPMWLLYVVGGIIAIVALLFFYCRVNVYNCIVS